ncbi:hypothetical protein N0O92_11405 [Alkalihalobacillus sp. MEB130]|uniref:hypothetical protein n=1 Tax=Alkalihalobacillus sp. MEB130 TaxID=2976704 RepID=UPI0028DDB2B7|nr:hypothetical protein [Alkalihalobacillus sp. MEB130]MDT8860837.1 hypothetical protein [Alkalihalobacillus sp. MEB130]
MNDTTHNLQIGELIAISKFFEINSYRMLTLLDKGVMEVFKDKEAFYEKHGVKETYPEFEWCELNNGKIFTKLKLDRE